MWSTAGDELVTTRWHLGRLSEVFFGFPARHSSDDGPPEQDWHAFLVVTTPTIAPAGVF